MWRLALPLLAVVMMACGAQTTIGLTHDASTGGPDATQDAGWVDVDAGSGPSDAGVSPDAGEAPDAGDLDAGAAADGGNPDGGGDDPDAGTNADAGTDLDAGIDQDASATDAGAPPDAGTDPDASVPDASDPDAGRDICADLAPCCRRLNGRDRRICEAAVASGDPARCEQALQTAQQQGVCLP